MECDQGLRQGFYTPADLMRFADCAFAFRDKAGTFRPGAEAAERDGSGTVLFWQGFRLEVEGLIGADGTPVATRAAGAQPLLIREPSRLSPVDITLMVLWADALAEGEETADPTGWIRGEGGGIEPVRLQDYRAYIRALRKRFLAFLSGEGPVSSPAPVTALAPVPCNGCASCPSLPECQQIWRDEDSLHLLPSVSPGQIRCLEAAGVRTVSALIAHDQPVPGLSGAARQRLATGAQLQRERKAHGPAFLIAPAQPGRGFALLPAPAGGDLFYRQREESISSTGGALTHEVMSEGQCLSFGGADGADGAHGGDRRALASLFSFLSQHCDAWPQARICHYGAADLAALRRLTALHSCGELILDRLLRENRFLDLQMITREALITSEADYSLAALGVFHSPAETGCELPDGCQALARLRDWLCRVRPAEAPMLPPPLSPREPDTGGKDEAEAAETAALAALLEGSNLPPDQRAALLALGAFHRREVRPGQWAVFDSLARDEEALLTDTEALAGLQAIGPVEPVKRSFRRDYRFPPQESRLRAGKRATIRGEDGAPAGIAIEAMDLRAGRITLKAGPGKAALLADRLNLHPDWPLDPGPIPEALRDVIADLSGPQRYRAAGDLLARRRPNLRDGVFTGAGIAGDAMAGRVSAMVRDMAESVLPIQGPPGTGKTWLTSRVILALLRAGARVGVASASHEAIRNLLLGTAKAAEEDLQPGEAFPFDILHKTGADCADYPAGSPVRATLSNESAAAGQGLIGATAWFFCRDENIQAFDWLFVDEAGQVGLATMLAMSRAAKNIVLSGDPCQLPQVVQAAHPAPADLSCLDWLAGGEAVLAPEKGLFLPVSRRMHPAVCSYISEQFYAGQLSSHESAAARAVHAAALPEAGVFWCDVAHRGNQQSAPEEVAAIARTVRGLLQGGSCSTGGQSRALAAGDIIVVAPYNAQVNALRAALPEGVRCGTVDKFQGQEALICLISMTGSSPGDGPRGPEFLLSPNRLNVAVSRAQALALVFGAPALREAPCQSLAQMRLLNRLAALPDLPPPPG